MSRVLLFVALLTASGAGLGAHHSIAGMYDSSQPVTLDGVVAEFAFVNPHPFIVVEVADGRMVGFTERKQCLHDMMASTVVVRG